MTQRRSDSVVAAALLTQRVVETPATPLKAAEYWALLERLDDPSRLLGLDAQAITKHVDVDQPLAARIEQLLAAVTPFVLAMEDLETSGLRIVPSTDHDYPSRLTEVLGRAAPPILYLAGDATLLEGPLLGIVGSRDVDAAAAEAAREAAVTAVHHGHGVVSGGAKGTDRLAMNAALDAGGTVVGVLADSLLRVTREADVRRAIVDGRACLCTPFKPSAGFSVANAMGRNKLIYAISRATLVVAADHDRGGTWAGATEALRQRTAPVLVWTGAGGGEGNHALVGLGARPVATQGDVFPLPVLTHPVGAPPDRQLSLDL